MITLTLTTEYNVHYSERRVIDNSLVFKKQFEWDETVTVRSPRDTRGESDHDMPAHALSLYDHRLVIDGVPHHILHFYSEG